MMFRHVRALQSAALLLVLALPAVAQTQPTPAQAQALLQAGPNLVGRLQAQLQASGLTPEQVKARLRAQGYSENLLDSYLVGGAADSTAIPGDDVFAALRSLGIADSTVESLRGDARNRRRVESGLDSAFLDTIARAARNDSVAAAIRRLLRSRNADADSGFTIFGLDLFRKETSQFDATLAGPVDPTYRFGAGDRLVLILTGDVQSAYPLEVTREGAVLIPNVGQVQVAGLTKAQLDEVLFARLGRVYSGVRRGPGATTQFSVNVSRVGTNQVIVTGDVVQPNSYAVSRAGTAMDALYKAMGPTENGSLRNIQIRRGATTVAVLDVYDYLVRGDASANVRLEHGDVVFVPPHGRRARVVGAILRAATYELKPGETVADLIRMAGGMKATADPGRVQIERILPPEQRTSLGATRKVIEIPRQAFAQNPVTETPIEDGDIVRVGVVPNRVAARISVTGNVWSAGFIGFTPGMTLTDALRRAGGLRPDSYLGQVQISRVRPDSTFMMLSAQLRDTIGSTVGNVPLTDGDEIRVFSLSEFRAQRYVTVSGAVRKPGRIPYREGMTMRDALLQAGGLQESALLTEAEIARMPENRAGGVTATTTRVSLDSTYLFDRTADGRYLGPPGMPAPSAQAPDVPLRPYDNILILRQPDWALQRTVVVQGEVNYPGRYTIRNKSERLLDLIERAGGLTSDAYANGVEFFRQRDNVGRIGVDLSAVIRDKKSVENLLLFDGDSIFVPVFSGIVQMSGEVNSPVAVAYRPGADIDYYVRAAGGGTPKADVGRAYVRQPNGKVESKNRRLGIIASTPNPEPGSTVVVPLADPSQRRDYAAILQVIGSILGSVVAIAAILKR
jgi:polysaccharide biosynthesis/export protein